MHLSIDEAIEECHRAHQGGIESVALFCAQSLRSDNALAGRGSDSLIARGTSSIRKTFPQLEIITDLCVCSYTTHGHCLLVRDGAFDEEGTGEELSLQALDHVRAGASAVMPSSTAHGAIAQIRERLTGAGCRDVEVIAQTAKFASNFYGAFRSVSGVLNKDIDKSSYQISPSDRGAAVERLLSEIPVGASAIMAKPALGYLDCIASIRDRTSHPLYVFMTSGESALLKMSHSYDERSSTLQNIIRAGADRILTALAREYY